MRNACPPKPLCCFQSVRWLVAEKSPDADFYFKCLRPNQSNEIGEQPVLDHTWTCRLLLSECTANQYRVSKNKVFT